MHNVMQLCFKLRLWIGWVGKLACILLTLKEIKLPGPCLLFFLVESYILKTTYCDHN